ncbi:MAG: antitoxin ParD1/3/4 [Saprospiraceae bacterium]|jgi:antitoxin ParD1/3/4|tara:strand:+ start:215 stop:460 length:246 start_codon:yes stop_codon:yes gene_type:complete
MSKNTSIILNDYFEKIINTSIRSGRYSSVSEVVRAGLRMVDEEESKIQNLKKAIEDGENSGYLNDFDPQQHLADLNSKYKQ